MLQECMVSGYYGDLQGGKRSQIGQKERYKKHFNIATESCEKAAQDRTKWRLLIRIGKAQYEENRGAHWPNG